MPRNNIPEVAERLQIPFLVHFTRTGNLASIMEHGLYPVDQAHKVGAQPETNDPLRLDRRLGGISTSISFPNASMFYKLRQDHPSVEWAILVLATRVLWEKDCLFCVHNAADGRVSGRRDDDLRGHAALEALFKDIEGHPSRADQKLRGSDPTDVQAEVLVMEPVEPSYILGAIFNSTASRDAYAEHFGTRKLLVHRGGKGFFANRTYFREFGGG